MAGFKAWAFRLELSVVTCCFGSMTVLSPCLVAGRRVTRKSPWVSRRCAICSAPADSCVISGGMSKSLYWVMAMINASRVGFGIFFFRVEWFIESIIVQ